MAPKATKPQTGNQNSTTEPTKRVKILRHLVTGKCIMVRRPKSRYEVEAAKIVYRRRNRNIVQILKTPSKTAIKMKYYRRGDLSSYIANLGELRMSFQDVTHFFKDILQGVAHLHRCEIAHRNLILKNIYLDKGKHCVISNFGCARKKGKRCHGRTRNKSFEAPEIFTEKTYDGLAADMWSLGVMLFFMLTGQTPCHSAIKSDLRFQQIQTDGVIPLISAWNLNIPSATCDLLNRLLTCDPIRRITAVEAIHHPFLRSEKPPKKQLERQLHVL